MLVVAARAVSGVGSQEVEAKVAAEVAVAGLTAAGAKAAGSVAGLAEGQMCSHRRPHWRGTNSLSRLSPCSRARHTSHRRQSRSG